MKSAPSTTLLINVFDFAKDSIHFTTFESDEYPPFICKYADIVTSFPLFKNSAI